MKRKFSASVFLLNDGKVLLIKHKLLGLWLPVGGELNEGETPIEAAFREISEETGLTAIFCNLHIMPDGTPPGFIGYEEHLAGSKGYHMNFCFVAMVDSRNIVGDGSFEDHKWFSLEEAQVLDTPPNVVQLLKIISRAYLL